jgi:hypothetical protein
MAPKTYECFVALRHATRNGRLIPVVAAYRADDPEFPGGWRDLVTDGTLAIWRVERSMLTQANDLVFAHLAGHAPHGVKQIYDRSRHV